VVTGSGDLEVDISDSGVEKTRYVRLVSADQDEDFYAEHPGYDLDAISGYVIPDIDTDTETDTADDDDDSDDDDDDNDSSDDDDDNDSDTDTDNDDAVDPTSPNGCDCHTVARPKRSLSTFLTLNDKINVVVFIVPDP
jgi:hypothetical protein